MLEWAFDKPHPIPGVLFTSTSARNQPHGREQLGGAEKPILAAVLAFGAAALLFLAVEELLVEAHEQAETTLSAAMFFAGFLIIYVLGELGG